ncbi:unnamed protein product [Ilex paraguariensis]|uniref:Rx N-terminal domain-containing protein n=1 Tax=Ilex paraguariensis TaxID=185542 RepID=A0ABC8TQS5_9AQUA
MADIQGLQADIVKEILKKALSLAAEEISLVWGFKGDLAKLEGSVKIIQAVLTDAERRGVNDESVKVWLDKLKDEGYRADDVLDEFAYEIARRKVEIRNQMRKKVCLFFSSSNPILFRSRMAHKIQNINTSLEKMRKEANDYGLQRVSQVSTPVTIQRETDSLLHQSEVVAAKIAGSMMRLKKDKDEWLSILNDGLWSAVGDANRIPLRKSNNQFNYGWHKNFFHQRKEVTRVGKGKDFQIEELGYLKNLRGKLDIYDLQEVGSKKEAGKAYLCEKENLYKLAFKWDFGWNGNNSDEGVLEGLQPSPSLKGLEINNFWGDNFPLWVMKMAVTASGGDDWLPLNNLVTIKLIGCSRCEHIPMLR